MAIYHNRGELDVEAQVIELMLSEFYITSQRKKFRQNPKHTKATVKMNTEIQNLLVHAVQHAEYSEAFLKRYLSTKKLTSTDFAEFYP